MHRSTAGFLLLLSLGSASAQEEGKTLFTNNCSACHQPQIQTVGPSLAEIGQLYRDKEADFLKWCHDPNPHKRQELTQMPAMVHIPVDDLKQIYSHIMVISRDLKEIKQKTGDPFPKTLDQRPMVQRIFMDKSGPASIAVALPGDLNFCWDAGECRLRYVWQGGFLDGFPYWRANGDGLARVLGNVFHTEEKSPVSFDEKTPPRFLGYTMKDGIPTFNYRSGTTDIHERLEPIEGGFQRTFTFKNGPSQVTLSFQKNEKLSYSSETGTWEETTLTAPTASPISVNIKLIK